MESVFQITNWLKGWIFRPAVSARRSQPEGVVVDLSSLEDRVLYSAVPFPIDVGFPGEIDPTDGDSLDLFAAVSAGFDVIESNVADLTATDRIGFAADVEAETTAKRQELLIVDRSVADYEFLVDDVLSNVGDDRTFVVRYLEDNEKGIEKISQILSAYSDLDSLHLVTHGRAGELQLGGIWLTHDSIQDRSSDVSNSLANWESAFASDADLLIYGCDVAWGTEGQAFVATLGELTGLDVAASSDITGNAGLGGDWTLEYVVGAVESDLAFSAHSQEAWEGTLSTSEVSQGTTSLIVQELSGKGRGNKQAIAMDAHGNHVVTWSALDIDSDGWGVFAQRYNSDGNEVGGVFQVNETEARDQEWASVAMDDAGNFSITWRDGDVDDVFMRRYDDTGTALTGEVRVNSNGDATDSSISANAAGNVVVTWTKEGGGHDVYASVFAPDGTAIREHFRVNTTLSGHQVSPGVSINDSGDFVVTWHGNEGVYAQRYNSSGTEVGGEIHVIQDGVDEYYEPDVALQSDGSFAVSYMVFGNNMGIDVRLYDSSGDFVQEIGGNQSTANDQYDTSIKVGTDGSYMLVWGGFGNQSGQGDSEGVFARIFESNGTAITGEFRVNDYTSGSQKNISVAYHDQNSYAFAYDGERATDSQGVFVSRTGLDLIDQPPVGSDGVVSVDEDTAHTISLSDFGYSDPDGDSAALIQIVTVPLGGRLFYRGQAVAAGDALDASLVNNGALTYLAESDESGLGIDGVEFKVFDGSLWSSDTYTLTFDVAAVVDTPEFAIGQSLESLDGPSLVNETTIGNQSEHQLAELNDGGYVVVWQDVDGDFSDGDQGSRILLRRYDAAGQAIGGVGIVDLHVPGDRDTPDVVGLRDGGFLVVWTVDTGGIFDVYAQRYDGNGIKVSSDGQTTGSNTQFLVAENTNNQQYGAKVAALTDGGFVVAWTTHANDIDIEGDIAARVFDANGNSAGDFAVNDDTAGFQTDATITALTGNRFAIGWVDRAANDLDPNDNDVKFKVFDAGDLDSGVDITANITTNNRQFNLQLTELGGGTILASWESTGGLDVLGKGVLARRFTSAGIAIDTSDVLINQETAGHQQSHSVVKSGQGGFVAFWDSGLGDTDGSGIRALRYDAAMNSVGSEFTINRSVYGDQSSPEAILLKNGEIVVAWNSSDGDNGEGQYANGIYQDRFIPLITGDEDQPIVLELDLGVADVDSESITSAVVVGLPSGTTISDGMLSWTSTDSSVSADVTGWLYDSITVSPPDDWHGSFDLEFQTTVVDNSVSEQFLQKFRVQVNPVDDSLILTNLSKTTDEASTLVITASTIAGSIVDPDQGVILDPTQTSNESYELDSSNPPPIAGANYIWTDSRGTGHEILLNTSSVSFDPTPNSTYDGIDGAFHFDGTGGGVSGALSDWHSENQSVELWVDVGGQAQTSTLMEVGDATFGFGLVLNGDQLEYHFYDQTTVDGNVNQPFVLVADGLISDDFNQVVIVSRNSVGSSGHDFLLYLNGDLINVLKDVPYGWSGASQWSLGQSNGFGYAGSETFGDFTGSIANVSIYSEELVAEEVAASYFSVRYQAPALTQIGGQAAVKGQTYALSSGAEIVYNQDGSFTYDPTGMNGELGAGQALTETIDLAFEDATGVSNSQISIVVEGLNDAPVLDNSVAMTLDPITENDVDNGGQTVASIIASAGGDRITDSDSNASEGIAITALSSGNGTWEFSIDGGGNWTSVGVASSSSALLLESTDLVRFVPDGVTGTLANFSFRAWDQTAGNPGDRADTGAGGGAIPVSVWSRRRLP